MMSPHNSMIPEVLYTLFDEDGTGGSIVPPSLQRERFRSNSETVAAGVGGAVGELTLSWVKLDGADLLDLSDPQHPIIIEAGDYVFNMAVWCDANPTTPVGAEGTTWWCGLDVDINGEDAYSDHNNTWQDATDGGTNQTSLTLTWWLPAGAVCQVAVRHRTDTDVDFHLEGFIRRLSTAGA